MELVQKTAPPAEEAQVSADLVRRIRAGDPGAEEEIWRRYGRGLLFLLKRRTRDPELAEDMRQETFRIALEKLRTSDINEPERLAAYLRGIAMNLLTGEWRKRDRRNTWADSPAVEVTADDRAGPLDGVERAEVATIVRQLLDELPVERDRQILLRFYLNEADKETICAELGIEDPVHFNRVLFRAKKRFRELVIRQSAKHRLRLVES